MFSFACIQGPIVVVIYWTVLRKDHVPAMWQEAQYKFGVKQTEEQRLQLFNTMIWASLVNHSLPTMCILVLMGVNATKLDWRDWKLMGSLQLLSGVYNCIVTKIRGQFLYPILKWEDYRSVVTTILISILSVFIFFGMILLERCIKYLSGNSGDGRIKDPKQGSKME